MQAGKGFSVVADEIRKLSEVQNLQNAAMVMNDSISEMSTGAQLINEAGAKLRTIAKDVSESVETIHSEISQFKL